MPQRLAATLALIAFAACLLIGGLHAGNSFSTTVLRALLALAVTYVLGLIVGTAAARMLQENLMHEEEKLKNSRTEPATKADKD
jgi:hypothetical protein